MIKSKHVFLIILPIALGYMDNAIINNYINFKLITYLNVAICGSKTDMGKMMKTIHEFGVTGNVADVANLTLNNNLIHKTKNYGIIIDGDCPNSKEILESIWKETLFGPSLLILFQANVSLSIFFEHINLNIISDVTAAVSVNPLEQLWMIYDVYNPAPYNGGRLELQVLGYHVSNPNNSWPKLESRYMARKNMTGFHFKSAVVIPEFHRNMTVGGYVFDESHKEKNSMHRFQCILMTYCQDFFNYTVVTERTNSWGYVIGNNSFDGLVGLLQHKLVDFGCSPLIFREDRLRVIDYSYGAWVLKSVFIFRPPSTSAPSFTIFTRPLGIDVWWSLIGSSVLIAICLKIVLRSERRIVRSVRTSLESSWSNTTMIIFGILFLQGTNYTSVLTSGKIIVLFMSILSILIYQFYSGYIVSFLLMAPRQTINDLQDLLDSSLDAGVEDILIDRDFIQNVKDKLIIDLFQKKCLKHHTDGFYLPEDGLKVVMGGGFAFHVETSSAYPIIKKTFPSSVQCELQEVQMYRTQRMYTNLQKKSPFRDIFNYCILRMVENGVVMRMRQIWDAQKPQCLDEKFVGHASVGIQEFSAALYVFFYGIVLSLFLLGTEIVWNKYSALFDNRQRNMNVSINQLKIRIMEKTKDQA